MRETAACASWEATRTSPALNATKPMPPRMPAG
jgi:hypothetical protein